MESRTVENLPPVIRGAGTKNAEEREQILAWLMDGEAHLVTNVEDRKAHNRLQQKIRGIAKAKGINVTIRYYPTAQETGFQAVVQDTMVATAARKRNNKKVATHSE